MKIEVTNTTAGPVRWVAERWVPDHDDGKQFTPGHWREVESGTIDATSAGPDFRLAGDGFAVKFWTDAAESDAKGA